jgi:uncharacterized protein YyaL (SSP411 family)
MEAMLLHPVVSQPLFFGHGLSVLEAMIAGPEQVAVVGEVLGTLHRTALLGTSPGLVVAAGAEGADDPPLLAHRTRLGGQDAAYLCRAFVCNLPTTDADVLAGQVGKSSMT